MPTQPHSFDLTAISTLVLATATFVSLFFARRQIRLGQEQLKQTQEEIALSRTEVEEAHKPVVVPYVDPTTGPFSNKHGLLCIPVQNVGSGPALRVQASVTLVTAQDVLMGTPCGPHIAGSAAAIAESQMVWIDSQIRIWGHLKEFEMSVTYEDLAEKKWRTVGRWHPARRHYEDMTIKLRS